MSLRYGPLALLLPLVVEGLSFEEYTRRYGKQYSGADFEERKALFERRREEIDMLNARPNALWKAGINEMTDLREAELRARRGYNKALRTAGAEGGGEAIGDGSRGAVMLSALTAAIARVDLPETFDWRDHRPSVISPVKAQGGCGSCWAFAAVESIESHIALRTGKLLSLSPQQLTSCTPNPQHCGGAGGCAGATVQLAFNYTVDAGGLDEIWNYPYSSGSTGSTEECFHQTGPPPPVAKITGYVQLPRNDAAALIEALFTAGPVAVSVDASRWPVYESGIFDHCDHQSPDINHAVQLVGYGVGVNRTMYWTLRNSWGTLWGEDGYIRIRRHHSVSGAGEAEPCGQDVTPQHGFGCDGGPASVEACGECGLLSDSVYPVGGEYGHTWELSGWDLDGGRRLQGAPGSSRILV